MNIAFIAFAFALVVSPQEAESVGVRSIQDVEIRAPGPGAPADMQLVVYDIADLLDALVEPPNGESELAENLSPRAIEEADAARRALLLEDAKRWMVPPFDEHGTLAYVKRGALIANLSHAQQKWLRAFIDLQRTSMQRVYVVETQFVRAESTHFDALALEDQTRVIGNAPQERERFEALLARNGVELISAPQVTSYARQASEVAVIDQTAYIREYVYVIVAPGNQHILDPIVDVVEDGVRAKCRVVPLPNERLGLSLDVSVIELKRPLMTKEVMISGYETPVTIGVPEVHTTRLETRMELARGETLIVSGRAKWPDGVVAPSPLVTVDANGVRRELVVAVRIGEVVAVKDAAGGTTSTSVLFSAF